MSCFIDEITLSLHTLSKENSYSILVGDFNIDLLKLNERQIFSKLFDNMCSSGFFPHITVPTRFATNSCSLIDQIYIYIYIYKNTSRHKQQWMTENILRSIKFRGKLYKQYLSKSLNSTKKLIHKSNLRVFNKILKKDIREAKKSYYYNEFNKYKGDIKKTRLCGC